ncbi:MAG: RluA family pseudouridine synthase [Ruminococcus sp.]|nr:RluA family pseudouridine synthase [Ruminococcus sp.]
MSSKSLRFTVPIECDKASVNTFLRKHCGVSARMITRLKREKDGILRDNKILRTIDILNSGDIVILNLPEDKNEIIPVKGDLKILFEDDYIIALDKPDNVPVHPTKIHQEDTLANFLAYRQKERGETYKFRSINRLDKDTSGIVVVAKDRFTASSLFKTVDKRYIAVCEGIIDSDGTIDKPIKLLEGHTIQRTCSEDGLKSVTHYKPVSLYKDYTLLEIKLETGHTHQIRCHFSSVGHPLLGDDMYGGSLNLIKRQALHCALVSFVHPITKEKVILKSELPEDIKMLTSK